MFREPHDVSVGKMNQESQLLHGVEGDSGDPANVSEGEDVGEGVRLVPH